MNQPDQVRTILLEEFIKSQAKNPQYSMRAYSRRIGISQSSISEIIAGKRPITKKTAQKILKGLDKDPNHISEILESTGSTVIPQKYQAIDIDSFHILSDWHYFAILSLAETKDFQSSSLWIAERLGISERETNDAITKLLQLKMIEIDKKTKKMKPTGIQFEAISPIASPALRKANRQNLELALRALDEVPLTDRDMTAITLCFDPSRMDDARKLIRNFRRNFNRVMESGHKKEVYKLCIHLFPLTQKRGSK